MRKSKTCPGGTAADSSAHGSQIASSSQGSQTRESLVDACHAARRRFARRRLNAAASPSLADKSTVTVD